MQNSSPKFGARTSVIDFVSPSLVSSSLCVYPLSLGLLTYLGLLICVCVCLCYMEGRRVCRYYRRRGLRPSGGGSKHLAL